MRIVQLAFDHKTATLEDGSVVDVSHQAFCVPEFFGQGHDSHCPCLDYIDPQQLQRGPENKRVWIGWEE